MKEKEHCVLDEICSYANNRTSNVTHYISTENMLPNKGGVCEAANVPSGAVIEYKVGDILISNIRPYFQKIWRADRNGGCSADVLCIRAKENVDSKYLYYLLSQQAFFDYVMSGAKGCKMPRGDKKQIMQWPVTLPPLDEQRRIAGILGSLDDKIELNRRINANLEAQAQALFRSWFVDFEPFRDGPFVDSELGKIPQGWKVKNLGELCNSISVTHSRKKGNLIFLNTGDIENGSILTHSYTNISDMPGQAKKSIQENDILYSEIRPINRHFAFVSFPASEYIVSTKLMVIRVFQSNPIRVYQYLTSDDIINNLSFASKKI